MGCNCKKKIEYIDKMYGDGGGDTEKSLITKIFTVFAQLLFGIVFGIVFTPIVLVSFVYITICMMTGKEVHFKLGKLTKYLGNEA